MPFVIVLFCLMIAGFGYCNERNLYNPWCVFYILWAVIVALASLELFGVDGASTKAYLVILLGLVFFFIGSLITIDFRCKAKRKNDINNMTININYLILYILSGLAICILFIISAKSVNLMMLGYTLSDIRYTFRDKVFDVGVVNFLYTYLARPVTILMMPISILIFFVGNKGREKIPIVLIAIVLVILVVISSGERYILLDFTEILLLASLIFSKSKANRKAKRKKKYFIVTIIAIFLIIVTKITINRGASVTENLYIYLVGCVPALGIKIDYFDTIMSYTYGLTSIKGFVRPFLVFSHNTGIISSMPNLYLTSEMLTGQIEDLIYIGTNIKYNGFVSIFYYFYLDFGLFGVMLFSFLYGMVCSKAYYNIKYHLNMKNCILYLLLAQSMLSSMFQFEFSNVCFTMSFYYLIIFFIRVKKPIKTGNA